VEAEVALLRQTLQEQAVAELVVFHYFHHKHLHQILTLVLLAVEEAQVLAAHLHLWLP
jgi:hypothetical protein